jgi:hypothetical protein
MTRRVFMVFAVAGLAGLLSATSARAEEEVTVTFENGARTTVQVYWLNGDRLEFFHELAPGDSAEQSTFVGHKWVCVVVGAQKAFTLRAPKRPVRYVISEKGVAA